MSSTISPNMNLIVPTVGSQPGPQYADNVNASLTLLDQHDHSPGKGIQINPTGININSDLTFLSNNAIALRSSRFTPQVSALSLPTDLGAIYVAGADLYYNDTAGNQVRLTQGGSIVGTAGSITGLPSGTASASYAGGVFVWQASTATGANMDFASAVFRNSTSNSKGLTLQPPNSMATDYSLTLPLIPVSKLIMTLDTSGNLAADIGVDNSTIVIDSTQLKVPAGGIHASNLNADAKGGMQVQTFTSIGTFSVPANINAVYVKLWSGGGGGGSGGTNNLQNGGGGGAGGSSGTYFEGWVNVTPLAVVSVVVGGGGGGAPGSSGDGTSGANGSSSAFGGLSVPGGYGGTGGVSGGGSGAGAGAGPNGFANFPAYVSGGGFGGNGGAGGSGGNAGASTLYANGGAGGPGINGGNEHAGGGGGGGAGWIAGGNGGAGGSGGGGNPGNGTNSGSGGGGGAGGNFSNPGGKAGSNGQDGMVIVYYPGLP